MKRWLPSRNAIAHNFTLTFVFFWSTSFVGTYYRVCAFSKKYLIHAIFLLQLLGGSKHNVLLNSVMTTIMHILDVLGWNNCLHESRYALNNKNNFGFKAIKNKSSYGK